MRSRPTKIRGRIGLIESGSGLIVGEVDLEGCSSEPIEKNAKYIKYHYIEDLELLDTWSWAWYLKNARRYKTPIPYNHPKGAVIWVKLKKNKYDL
ncbi:hypothetical protein [Tenacibaculum sp. MAR_2009_124]|uniref:hypothetical protein n=1 Tax=Tenacibaculum sp. MAR_2009_124 TaxID=1250059 RepID=UPI00115FA4B3|nr:hypothetical protein [Tenacibaculum sp. MAR_2009_124]